jgi:hypothetical protein
MKATLAIEAANPSEVLCLGTVLSTLAQNWPNDFADPARREGDPAKLAALRGATVAAPAPAPAPAPADADGGESGESGGDSGDDNSPAGTGPMRGKNAETHAKRILDAISAVETVGGLEDVLKDAAATVDRLPEKWRKDINTLANTKRLTLPAAPTAEQNQVHAQAETDALARMEALGASVPQAEPATPAPAAPQPSNDFVVFEGDGTKRAGYSHAADAAKVINVVLDAAAADDEVSCILEKNAATLARFPDDLRQAVETHANAIRQRIMFGEGPAAAPSSPAKVYTVEDCRKALEACIAGVSFAEAQARMKALGYGKLSDIPDDADARARFCATLLEGVQPAQAA